MLNESAVTGLRGEIYAARYLRDSGYDILAANYATRAGEIDIVAAEGDVIVFVEVKTRKAGGMFPPSEAVDRRKEENVRSAAAAFMSALGSKKEKRFDIIEVTVRDGVYETGHIKNAF